MSDFVVLCRTNHVSSIVLLYFLFIQTISISYNTLKLNSLVHSPGPLLMKESDTLVIILRRLIRCFWKQATNEVTITTLTKKKKKS